jgi:hypothetical protein
LFLFFKKGTKNCPKKCSATSSALRAPSPKGRREAELNTLCFGWVWREWQLLFGWVEGFWCSLVLSLFTQDYSFIFEGLREPAEPGFISKSKILFVRNLKNMT